MSETYWSRIVTVAAIAFLTAIPVLQAAPPPAAPAAAPAQEKGDLWEVTSQMSMEGLPVAMPAQKSKVCAPKTWTEPPTPENPHQKCTNSDFQMDGSKATWKVNCEPPHAMTGTGEIARDGADAYSGALKFAGADGTMTIKLDGHKVGECDKPSR